MDYFPENKIHIYDNDLNYIREVDLDNGERVVVTTKKQREAYQKKQRRRTDRRAFAMSRMDKVLEVAGRLSSTHAGYLTVLLTYITFEDSLLRDKKSKKTMRQVDIIRELGINKNTARTFLKTCKELKIMYQTESKEYGINPDFHFVGKNKGSKDTVKTFRTAIEKLRKSNSMADIGIIYKLQGFLHISLNALVKNPQEKDRTKLELLSKKDLADNLGITQAHLTRIMKRLVYKDMFVMAECRIGKEKLIFVNPLVFTRTASIKDNTIEFVFNTIKP